jgi:Bacterial Ig domain
MNKNRRLFLSAHLLLDSAFIFLAMATLSTNATPTIWTGPNITYTHTSADASNPTLPANSDQITPNVWITRATSLGIFNAKTQTSYGAQGSQGSGTPDGSPSDTEWAIGSIDNYASLSYGSWFSVLHGADGVGQQAVLHLISENIYISIEFTSFSEGGTFTYVRSTPAVEVTPTVTITNPAAGAVFAAPATVLLGASASATGGTVTNVSFFTNSVLAGSSTVAPYTLTLNNVHVGAYALTAVATASGISATSAVVNISVVPPPSVAITNPVSGTVFAAPTTVQIGASASVVMGSITNVEFFQGSTFLGSVMTAPFTFTASNLTAGPYTFEAVATAAGLSTTSSVVNVTVINPSPVTLTNTSVNSGQFSFSYNVDIGLRYVIQSSSNLMNWVPLATNTATVNPAPFSDPLSTNEIKFYRVGRLPNP